MSIKIVGDTHTHSIASGDAHSTILENVVAAKKRNLEFLCLTEHINMFPTGATSIYFKSLVSIPKHYENLTIFKGIEANVVSLKGSVDASPQLLEGLEWRIASMHSQLLTPGTLLEHTKAWIRVAENPYIDVIGHCGNPKYSFELKPVIEAFKTYKKVVEINNHSFSQREGSITTCTKIAEMCALLEVPIVVCSDAHFVSQIGQFDDALSMLEEIQFPDELILNSSLSKFESFLFLQ